MEIQNHLGKLRSIPHLQDQPYLVCHQQQWKTQQQLKESIQFPTSFTLLTINVLTDHITKKQKILCSQERYTYIIEQICQMSPDFVTINEATFTFCNLLCQNKQIQDKYFISSFNNQQTAFFNLILSKIQPLGSKTIKIQTLPRSIPMFYFIKNKKLITISSVHLISHDINHHRRKQQFGYLDKKLKLLQKTINMPCLHITQGDFNLHSQDQNVNFQQLEFQDAWLYKYSLDNNPGYTFDSIKNSMIQQYYWGFQQRRMRLDRILFKGKVNVEEIKVVLDKALWNKEEYDKMGLMKRILSFGGDLFGYNIFRQKQKYLFPSDHFGLWCKVNI